MGKPIGDVTVGLVKTAIDDALAIAATLEMMLEGSSAQALVLPRSEVLQIRYALRCTAQLLDKYFKENRMIGGLDEAFKREQQRRGPNPT